MSRERSQKRRWIRVPWWGLACAFSLMLTLGLPDVCLESWIGPLYMLWALAGGWAAWLCLKVAERWIGPLYVLWALAGGWVFWLCLKLAAGGRAPSIGPAGLKQGWTALVVVEAVGTCMVALAVGLWWVGLDAPARGGTRAVPWLVMAVWAHGAILCLVGAWTAAVKLEKRARA